MKLARSEESNTCNVCSIKHFFDTLFTYHFIVIPHSARDYGEYADPPGYLEQHVWPGYLRELEMARSCSPNVNCK